MSQHEDDPSMTPAIPVPDELQQLPLERRETLIPRAMSEAEFQQMVRLSLSSMATTLGSLDERASRIPTIHNQHDVILTKIEELKGTAVLAGNLATLAKEAAEGAEAESKAVKEAVDRIEGIVGKLARSMEGVEECTRSLYQAVFPERQNGNGHDPDPEIEYGELVPFRRSNTGD